ncbi:hypothetical protein [Nonomuraea guangzhouensis]|uniref:WD40 repeat domain-containing protein n=1 Tax=Nonomuraea guangzhouensis TaxID=1291555 RepID=A0ABW4GG97_9ACTN|nr:hypothetical protein [Nonomuraea guangzhouensis]
MRTENELSGALRDAANQAPDLDLIAGVGERRRRRTRRRAQLLAAVAVVAVVSTSTVVTRGTFSSGGGEEAAAASTTTRPQPEKTITLTPRPRTEATATPQPKKTITVTPSPRPQTQATGTPVEKLWPQALFQMPAKNADGWPYQPIIAINATEVLLGAGPSPEKAGKIEVYDTKIGKSRVVTEIPTTPGLKQPFQAAVSTDGTNVVWYTSGRKDGALAGELWWAPLAGGKAKRAVTLTGAAADIDAVGTDGKSIVWSMGKGGVYRKSFTGGAPHRVPETDGLHLIRWPWAGDAGNVFIEADRNQSKIVNLADGTVTKTVIKDGMKGLRCGRVWCRGRQGGTAFVQRLNGTGFVKIPDRGFIGGPRPYPVLDRFLPSGENVFDLNTGKVARIKRPGVWIRINSLSEPSTVLYWGTTTGVNPDKYWVLNLAAVPPAQ